MRLGGYGHARHAAALGSACDMLVCISACYDVGVLSLCGCYRVGMTAECETCAVATGWYITWKQGYAMQ